MKRSTFKRILLSSWILLLTLCCGCSGILKEGITVLPPALDRKQESASLTIGVSLNSADEFRSSWMAEFSRRAEEKGYRVIGTNADGVSSQQISDLENLMLQDLQVLVIHPLSTGAISPLLEKAKEKGIFVVIVDFGMEKKYENLYDVFVADDQQEVAKIQADYVENWLAQTEGRAAYIGCIAGSETGSSKSSRQQRFYREMGDIQPVAEAAGYWKAENAVTITEGWMQAHPEINVYVCMNDDMAIGVIQALLAAGKDMEDVLVIGVDGLSASIPYLKSGELDCTAGRDIAKEVNATFEVCEGLVAGKTYPKHIYPEAIYALTKENVGEYYG